MKLGLICSDNIRSILLELFLSRNITLDDQSTMYIVEAGYKIPEDKIAILFGTANIGNLIKLVDQLSKIQDDNGNTIIGKSNEDCYEVIPYPKVYYFEARGNNVFCITVKNEYRVKEKLYELEARLPQKKFIRVGRSYIVNIDNVKEIIPWFGRHLMLRFINSKKEIEVSKSYVKSFKEFLGM